MGTVQTGEVPGPLSDITDPPTPLELITEAPDVGIGEIAPFSRNNRLLLIGDSIFEAANDTDLACSIITPLGWSVEVDAVGPATIDFGFEVVDSRMENGDFGAVGVMLGNNVTGSVDEFAATYRELIEVIGPRPILAFTPAGRPDGGNLDLLNAVRTIADETPNVRIVDWGFATQARPDEMLTPDLLPTPEGATELWTLTGVSLGAVDLAPGSEGDASNDQGDTSDAPAPGTTALGEVGAEEGNAAGGAAPAGDCLPPTFTTATYNGSAVVNAGGDDGAPADDADSDG